jgi:hypothetical protein
MNNYTALIEINDTQGGGDNYAFEVSWRADADIATAPAPFFDDVRSNESRDLTYSCVVDTRQNQVISGLYQYSGASVRTDRPGDRKQVR